MNTEASELKSQDKDSNSASVLSEEESSGEELSGDEGVHITCTSNASQRFESHVRQKFLSHIIENIQERFPQAELLEAFSILDPQGLVGDDQLEIILDHYKNGQLVINPGDCLKEHSEFVEVVKSHTHVKNCKTLVELLQRKW